MIPREIILRKRITSGTWVMIIGLVLSGATAIPLQTELDLLARWLGAAHLSPAQAPNDFTKWILIVRDALHDTYARYRFMGYGTDWLAFGHFVIALAYVGALRHPLRNAWVFSFGMMACVAVIPWALLFGELRGIPIYWRFIDCAFGVLGFIPNWLCHRWTREMEAHRALRFE